MSNKEEFNEWLKDKPQSIKDLGGKLKPWVKYRIKATGQHCIIKSYDENGTVMVAVTGHDDEFLDMKYLAQPMRVCGVKSDELELNGE
jgi:hypothetical protein